MASQSPVPSDTVKVEDSADAVDQGRDHESTPPPATTASSSVVMSKERLEMMNGIVKQLSDHKEDDHQVSGMFQRMIQKRMLPDYYEVIKEPVAFSAIRAKILKKQYKDFKEFVRDFALISHNAQVYNRPSAPVYGDAILLRDLFKAELQKLVDEGKITAEEAELPDLGEIPEVEDSPPPGPDDEEEEEDEEEDEEEEEEEEESDDDTRKHRGRKRGQRSSAVTKREGKVEDTKDEFGPHKTRGRPPKVETAMEKRISTLLKGLRKPKNPGGELKIVDFERLPDKSSYPEYYQEIKNPIAMDIIKKKAKRKKYQSVDQALQDLELTFENAKAYNKEGSKIYNSAVDLQLEARALAEQEKRKPDSDFVDEDGRLPLSQILHKGEVYKVGDWVHLRNDNDQEKPIPAQIYRTWQDGEGRKWINACWYFRPEQTVHRFEKHFFENEVVKTGRYEDHLIDDVVDRCFVMFFTRYNKGRPLNFPEDKQVYVCEARYNEEKFKLNKIKTWASCVPDEVRDKDYEMRLFDFPRKMKKVPSPIIHLLKADAKETDPLPQPTWGEFRGPPRVGAVHRRPREANESPPPEPTPSPPPVMEAPSEVRRPPTSDRPRYDSQGDITMSGSYRNSLPLPMNKQNSMHTPCNHHPPPPRPSASPAPMLHQGSYGSHGPSHSAVPQTPHFASYTPYNAYGAPSATPIQQSNPLVNYSHYQNSTLRQPAPQPTQSTQRTNTYDPPRVPEVYVFEDIANNNIPSDIRDQFHTDDSGKVIFYTAPPQDTKPLRGESQDLGHSLRYLADKARQKEAESKKRAAHEAELEAEAAADGKRRRSELIARQKKIYQQKVQSVDQWVKDMEKGTDDLYKDMYGKDWEHHRLADKLRQVEAQEEAHKKVELEKWKEDRKKAKEVKIWGFRF